MADDSDQSQPAPKNVRKASPGVGGAISDAVAALSKAFAPKALTDRQKRLDQGISDAEGSPDSLGNRF